MRGGIASFILAAGVVGTAAPAVAQPSSAPVEPDSGAYPAEHTERPLLLPLGGVEGGALLEVQDVDYDGDGYQSYRLTPGVRYGLRNAEVEANVVLGLHDSPPGGVTVETDTLQAIELAGRLGLGESATAGVELALNSLGEDYASYGTRAVIATKRRYGAASLDAGAFAGYRFASDAGFDSIEMGGRLAATAQVSPVFALQARAEISWIDFTESQMGVDFGWFLGQQYGVHALFAASPSLDVIAGFDQLSSSGQYGARLFTVGIAGRRVP